MGSQKNNRNKKTNTGGNTNASTSDNVKQRLRTKRKTEESPPANNKKRGSSSKTKNGQPQEKNIWKDITSSFDFSPLNYIKQSSFGECSIRNRNKFAKTFIINDWSRNKNSTILSPFERRVTSIAWHPKFSQICAAGSKGGELSLYNLNKPGSNFIPGIGPGGSIVGMKFHRDDPALVYTTSITGDIRLEDFSGCKGKLLASIGCFEHWFSSLDICYDKKLLIAGSTIGNVSLLTERGQTVWRKSKSLHKKKITHIEFSGADSNLFVTASIDRTVKLWDLRSISEFDMKPKPVCEFVHLKGVNSAYFSPSNRYSLLTTDQYNEIRVYSSPMWNEELIISHPHRQFQHLTPIKATWHPLEDIIVVGRYPDTSSDQFASRSIDFFDGKTGELLYKLQSPTGGIISLNSFNVNGDCLASGTGSYLMFWKDENVFDGAAFRRSMFYEQRRTTSLI